MTAAIRCSTSADHAPDPNTYRPAVPNNLTPPYWYRGYGLLFRSDIDLPEFAPAQPGTEDARIRLGKEASDAWARIGPDARSYGGFCDSPLGPVMRVGDLCDFLIPSTSEIVLNPLPGADAGLLRQFLLGATMGLFFHQRGYLVLHGAAILHQRGLTIFVGESGSGKSTLAAHLGQRGEAVLADDLLPLMRQPDGHFAAWPGSRVL